MNRQEAVGATVQILDEERIYPTVKYQIRSDFRILGMSHLFDPERMKSPRPVRSDPTEVQLTSDNFTYLCAIAAQVSEQDTPAFLSTLMSRISSRSSYRHVPKGGLPGCTANCSSELPLIAEFMVRRGYKHEFLSALSGAATTPGLTLMLKELLDMIASILRCSRRTNMNMFQPKS